MSFFKYRYNNIFTTLILLLFTISCHGKKQNDIVNKSVQQDISRIDSLRNLVLSSNFPFDDIPKDKINILIDSQTGCVYLCKLFYDTNGTGTIGWVEYDTENEALKDVSPWLEKSKTLFFDRKWSVSNLGCLNSNKTDLLLSTEKQQVPLYIVLKFPFCSRDYIEDQDNYSVTNSNISNNIVNLVDSLNYDSSNMNVIELKNEYSDIRVLILEVFRGETTHFLITTIFDDIVKSYKEIGYTGSSDLIFKEFCITKNLEISTNKIQYINDDFILKAKDTLETIDLKVTKTGEFINMDISK